MSMRNILYIGSYWQKSNDIVYLMQRSLERMQALSVTAFDPLIYDIHPSPHVIKDGCVNWIRDEVISNQISRCHPSVLICNAGGLSPTADMHQQLENQGIFRICIALSDPDDFGSRTRRFAPLFNQFFTNAVESITCYREIGVDAKLLPFAADPVFHRPLESRKAHDVVVVGGWRPERAHLVSVLRAHGLRTKCHGKGWRNRLAEKIGLSCSVHGEAQVAAINSGLVYLSFALTKAGYTNVKVGIFEAASCAACILVEDFEELHRYFAVGEELVTFRSESEAVEKASWLKEHPEEARRIGAAARSRLVAEHTWEHRWQGVLRGINGER